jgi:hypothetical protein
LLAGSPSIRAGGAEAAHALGDDALVSRLLREVAETELGAADRAALADDLARADELRT